MFMNRRLYRCRHDQRLAGVASGVAEFFDLDPTLVRVLFFLSIFLGGFGLLLYIGLAIIVPLEPLADGTTPEAAAGEVAAAGSAIDHEPHRHASRGGGGGQLATFAGLVLILIGALALVDAFLPAWSDSGRYLWPVFLIGIGALLVARAIRRAPSEP
jgi:phage shock protein C